ncbi:DNA cytosine methyltransferase [Isoptericola sp. NPDC056134]|uniref:DNA cytosine methyltransferase n=1 Tax=Isoptericola sp. NPDC056134 TaxID=3345723 RepID=UPI0035E9FDDE
MSPTSTPEATSRQAGGSGGDLAVIDLFAGAGGLSAGLHRSSSRFRVAHAVESDVAAAATYAKNFGDVVHAGPIEDWLKQVEKVEADVIVGGPPCQGFSSIGSRDPNDARNSLWRYFVETVRRARPRVFVMENVPAFIRSREYAEFVASFVEGELRAYELVTEVVDSADHGAPQHRRRAIVMGFHRDEGKPVHLEMADHPKATVRDAFQGVRPFVGDLGLGPRKTRVGKAWLPGAFRSDELHFTRTWSATEEERFRAVPYGGSRIDLPRDLAMRCWNDNPRSASDVMGRLVWERPSVTIRTEFFRPEKGRFTHPTQHRAITHWEAARLQGFDDDYLWVGGRADIARQIGNAVPVHLGEAIGRHLAATLA